MATKKGAEAPKPGAEAPKPGAEAPKPGAEAPKPPPIREVLRSLAGRSKILNALDDELSDGIRVVEDVMREHLGTRVVVPFLDYDDGDVGLLAYTKINGKWCLAVETGSPLGDPGEYNKIQLSSAPREMRAMAFGTGVVEKLIRQAIDQVETQISQRQLALASAGDLLRSLAAFRNAAQDPATDGPPPIDDDLPF